MNWAGGYPTSHPIVCRERHHDHLEIVPFSRSADFCMVTSLHDSMNLVAKEFVAARGTPTASGSRTARALRNALLVNPYDRRGQ